VAQRLAALSQLPNVDLEICSPEPWFPLMSLACGERSPRIDEYRGLKVYRPRYFYIPKYFKQLDARFYSYGLSKWVCDYYCSHHPDILDAHFAWPDGVGVYHLARKLNVPYSITLRGWIWFGMKQPKLWKQAVDALRNASVIISLCRAMADVCRDIGCDEKRLVTIHNGIDRQLFFPVERSIARRTLDLPADVTIIVCVSFFRRIKGLLELIEAMSLLPKESLLILVGEPAEQEYYKQMLLLIERLGMKKRVLLAGAQPHTKIPLYMNAADVTALPSYWEGSPNAVVESLGCGTPVVATPVGSVPEQVRSGFNGYIVPIKNSEALAEALSTSLSKEWKRKDIADSVQSWHDVALSIKKVFDCTLGK